MPEQSETSSDKFFSIWDSTLYVGAITVWAYIWGFSTELGSKTYYKIPDMFIEIDSGLVFKSIGNTWVYLVILVFGVVLFNYFSRYKKAKPTLFLVNGIFCLVSVVLFVSGIIDLFEFTYSAIVFVIIILTILLVDTNGAVIKFIFLLLCTCLVLSFSQKIGYNQAESQTSYLVIERTANLPQNKSKIQEKKYYVVIDIYKKYFLVADYDINKHEIYPEFELIQIKDASKKPYILKYMNTGNVTVADQARP